MPILLQGSNGPCPLLAICNILLLRGHIFIHEDMPSVTFSHVVTLVATRILESNPPSRTETDAEAANRQAQLDDAISLLSVLARGLDVNVEFCPRSSLGTETRNPCLGFEYTREFTPFDMCAIDLVHGWLADPQDAETTRVLTGLSYNHAVERLVAFRSLVASPVPTSTQVPPLSPANGVPPPYSDVVCNKASSSSLHLVSGGDVVPSAAAESGHVPLTPSAGSARGAMESPTTRTLHEGGVIDRFLDTTASQLTYYGLLKLHSYLKDEQLVVFFRANHFNVMVKHSGKLYLLVTDEGYREENEVVWELLDGIDGDTELCNETFGRPQLLQQSSHPGPVAGLQSSLPANLVDPDFLLALEFQGETQSARPPPPHSTSPPLSIAAPAVATNPLQVIPVLEGRPAGTGSGVIVVAQASNVQVVASVPASATPVLSNEINDADFAKDLQRLIDRESSAAPGTGAASSDCNTDTHFAMMLQQQLDFEGRGPGEDGGKVRAADRRRQHENADRARSQRASARTDGGGGCAMQ